MSPASKPTHVIDIIVTSRRAIACSYEPKLRAGALPPRRVLVPAHPSDTFDTIRERLSALGVSKPIFMMHDSKETPWRELTKQRADGSWPLPCKTPLSELPVPLMRPLSHADRTLDGPAAGTRLRKSWAPREQWWAAVSSPSSSSSSDDDDDDDDDAVSSKLAKQVSAVRRRRARKAALASPSRRSVRKRAASAAVARRLSPRTLARRSAKQRARLRINAMSTTATSSF